MRQQHFATNKYTYEGLVKRLKINTHKTVATKKNTLSRATTLS